MDFSTDRQSLNLGHVTDDYSVAPQFMPADMAQLRDMGFRSVLFLRPDFEAQGQPNHTQLVDAARAAGLEARYLPCNPATMGPAEVASFKQNLEVMPTPMVGTCASGSRAMVIWALAMSGERPAGEIIDLAMMAGHDISHIATVLE